MMYFVPDGRYGTLRSGAILPRQPRLAFSSARARLRP